MSRSSRFIRRIAPAVMLCSIAACDLENATSVTLPETSPVRLVRGAAYMAEVFANDYGNNMVNANGEGGTGEVQDPYTNRFFERNFTWLHEARALAKTAVDRSVETRADSVLGLAHVWHGWINVRLAEIWGDQPLGDGVTHTAEEIFATALADFEAARDDQVDSVRYAARAGIARVNWILGRDNNDPAKLNAAITAAESVLSEKPTFHFAPIPGRVTYLRSFTPAEAFKDIPIWNRTPSMPQGIKLIDADELHLIQAEAHLLLGDLAAAKTAVKAMPLLPVNHVGLGGRDPNGAPLTQAEIDALVDPADEATLRFIIEELRRENIFTHGRRNVGPKEDGTMFPLAPPKNA